MEGEKIYKDFPDQTEAITILAHNDTNLLYWPYGVS